MSSGSIEWPPELDALIAAPDHHKLLMENDEVRVLETRILPGDKTPVHTHCWSSVYYILSLSPFIRRDHEENILLDSRTVPPMPESLKVLWSAPLPPHSLENVGEKEIYLISVEIKRA